MAVGREEYTPGPRHDERAGRTDARTTRLRPQRETVDLRRVRRRLAPCPEIDCLRHMLPPGTLAAAEMRAAEIGVGADRVLVAAGALSEDEYALALSHHLGIGFEPLDQVPRTGCPFDDDHLIGAGAAGMFPLRDGRRNILLIAPRHLAARHLANFVALHPDQAARVRLTTGEQISRFVARYGADAIGNRAAHALQTEQPQFSAGARQKRFFLALTAAIIVTLGLVIDPRMLTNGIDIALAVIFLGWTMLRLIGALTTGLIWRRHTRLSDDKLPVYTMVAALYREAASVEGLVRALEAMDYPPEKLDIKLVVEPDDAETRFALAALRLRAPFEIVVAPATGPRTKPKALNAALPSARGSLIAVYDAEDRPEPNQLRLALEAFQANDSRLACVQARLTIDNAADTFLTRLFAAEYAGLFDVFLPGLAAWRLPLPLGGSSNHFRTDILRKVGGWDPYNVTEDADLGMRLSRLGYSTAVIDSVTYEEAPSRLLPWLRQRTRWFKGWMQTWLVHMRHPLALWSDLGLPGFAVFQLVVGGTVLAALIHLLFAAEFAWDMTLGSGFETGANFTDVIVASLHGTTLVAGYLISAFLALIGLARRRLLGSAWWLLLMPLYWLLLSIAAWRALWHLIRDPYRWEKTEHGLARTSRLAGKRSAKNGNIDAAIRPARLADSPWRISASS